MNTTGGIYRGFIDAVNGRDLNAADQRCQGPDS
jgi:hypothetical protein